MINLAYRPRGGTDEEEVVPPASQEKLKALVPLVGEFREGQIGNKIKMIGGSNSNSNSMGHESSSIIPINNNTSASAYTTIPISGNEVISRSLQNLSAFISLRRPWPEFISSFDRPDSLSNAGHRLRKNGSYFRVNYGVLVFTCGLLSMIPAPLSLILVSLVLGLWLILYFFREDPLYLCSRYHISDGVVIAGLISVSILAIWFTGVVQNLVIGVVIGILVSVIHGVFRNSDGLFMDETEAVTSGLIIGGSAAAAATSHYHHPNRNNNLINST